ncbi:MAG: methylated-DNA--[protein]-cysteine S-methyltransferase [Pseudomonadota bacterium]
MRHELSMNEPDADSVVASLCRHIQDSDQFPDLDALATQSGLSRHQLHRRFKKATGLTPRAYAAECRAVRVRNGLASGASVTAALFDAGYNSPGRFYAEAQSRLGMAPSTFRDGGRDMRIRFAVAACSLGAVLVAATKNGVCCIEMGDDPEALTTAFQARFAKANIIGAEPDFDQLVALVCGHIDQPNSTLKLPLDIRGTVFQQKVWSALQTIAHGQTATYTDIAKAIGQPNAHRAVARACAANPVAIAVPCHRVVRKDGGLSGYRWGIERKRALLDREGASRSPH